VSEQREKSSLRSAAEFLLMLALCIAFVFGFVRPVVASPVYVPSESMLPTLEVWDRVLVNELADDFSGPRRGDVVVFENPQTSELNIKRAAGLPEDSVKLRAGNLYINGEPVEEPYVEGSATSTTFGPVRVPEGHYFVLGDNRGNSVDSRAFGPVPEGSLVGEALLRFRPPGRTGAL
jgi:signal peptidase I